MRSQVSLGIFFVLLSSVFFAPLSQTATKYLAGDFPVFQIVFFRSLGQTAWMFLYFWPKHGFGMFRSARPSLQITRSTLLFVSSLFWINAVAVVPLTTASSINFTAPIMVVLLSIPLLGEKVGIHRWAAVVVGFIGALVVIQPDSSGVPIEVWWLFAAAFLFALYQILTRKLAAIDHEATSAIYTILVALVVSAVVLPWHYEPVGTENALVWIAFAATGLLGGLRHFFVVKAYGYASASIISPFFYCELVGVTLLGFFIFGDIPASTTWAGAAIIAASGIYIAYRERVKK
jgi:drug/metabolite transporter (DMT)-like permease